MRDDVMATVASAQRRIVAAMTPLAGERVAIEDAAGRVLAAAVVSRRTLPPFDNSAMDGYAVRAADVREASAATPVVLPVAGESRAGAVPSLRLHPGTAMRIMTGAPLPAGADAVIRHEDTDNGRELVALRVAVQAGNSVRRGGEDVRPGQTVLEAGHRLRGADLALCAALGHASLEVRRRPRVAVLATGDELVEAGTEPGPGQIVDSNTVALAAAIREAGGDPLRLPIARDDVVDLRRRLREAARADLVISSAGVSVGDHDHVRDVVIELGSLDFWRVAMRPGKPLAVGTVLGTPFIGLPGNPVSSQVTFELFARAAILALQGATRTERPRYAARALEPMSAPEGLETFHRAELVDGGPGIPGVRLTGPQGSGIMLSMVLADCLVVLPAGGDPVAAGQIVSVIPLR